MTRDELYKRIVRIEATPLIQKADPRSSGRREFSDIDLTPEHELSEFESFFEFEKDIVEIESARKQLERLGHIEIIEPNNESCIILEEVSGAKEGSEDSFFSFDEIEEVIENIDNEESVNNITTNDTIKEEVIEGSELTNTTENTEIKMQDFEVAQIKEPSVNFKFCKYIKVDGESCKRQAPKDGEYCSSHRKVLAKEQINTNTEGEVI